MYQTPCFSLIFFDREELKLTGWRSPPLVDQQERVAALIVQLDKASFTDDFLMMLEFVQFMSIPVGIAILVSLVALVFSFRCSLSGHLPWLNALESPSRKSTPDHRRGLSFCGRTIRVHVAIALVR
jgi:hypothetical protein